MRMSNFPGYHIKYGSDGMGHLYFDGEYLSSWYSYTQAEQAAREHYNKSLEK